MNGNSRTAKGQRGFTIMQMVITVVIISIVSTVGVLGIKTARAEFRVRNSARVFASYLEKARADSVRRHADSASEASVESSDAGNNTYIVTMDFGDGTLTSRTFQLESGVTFNTIAKKISFNWRGRVEKFWVFQIKSDYTGSSIPVDVSGSGDVTVDEQHFPDESIPDVTVAAVTDDVDHSTPTPTATPTPSPTVSPSPSDGSSPSPTATPTPTATPSNNGNGNGNGSGGNSGNGNGNATPTPTPTPTPSASPSATPIPQCVAVMSPSTITLSQSVEAQKTGTSVFRMTNATGVRTISASQAGNGNSMVLGLSLVRIDGSGSSVLTVTSKNGAGNRGVFIVNVTTDPACGSGAQLTVSVSN
jgi:hypothetical protein